MPCTCLLLMDHTVVLVTSPVMCIRKINVVLDYSDMHGMMWNETITKYFVVYDSGHDKLPIMIQGYRVSYCIRYLYLGVWFADKGRTEEVNSCTQRNNILYLINEFAVFLLLIQKFPFTINVKYLIQLYNICLSVQL